MWLGLRRQRWPKSKRTSTSGVRISTPSGRTRALGQRCPAEFYVRSPRCYPEKIAVWEYPADHQVRRVGGDGYIKWRDGKLYLSEALRKETIALTQRDDGNWAIRFRNFDLGTLTDEGNEIRRSGLVRLSQGRPQAAM